MQGLNPGVFTSDAMAKLEGSTIVLFSIYYNETS